MFMVAFRSQCNVRNQCLISHRNDIKLHRYKYKYLSIEQVGFDWSVRDVIIICLLDFLGHFFVLYSELLIHLVMLKSGIIVRINLPLIQKCCFLIHQTMEFSPIGSLLFNDYVSFSLITFFCISALDCNKVDLIQTL